MSTIRPTSPKPAGAGPGLASALLVLGGFLALFAGPELVRWAYSTPGVRPVPYYLLAGAGVLVVGVLLVRGCPEHERHGHAPRVRCPECGALNERHARFCNQCAAPVGVPRRAGQEEARCAPGGKSQEQLSADR